ncbi:MAG: hypothetical protein ACXABY_27725 [Candidatus Thorarchaeota archaeon]|jgi:hypothetical protein
MSRYHATTKDGKEMAFGYDRPMTEYFVNVYDEKGDLIEDTNSSGNSMVAGYTVGKSNSTIYERLKELMDPTDWAKHSDKMDQLLLDLPF